MKYDKIKNPNYVATIVRITTDDLHPVEGLDNLVAYRKFGMQALVPKDMSPGPYVLFSTETQLSHEFASENNLYRKAELNKDTSKKGYLEESRRVKAIKLRGNRSDALVLELDSLWFLGLNDIVQMQVGDVFDSINGIEICRKYVVPGSDRVTGGQPKSKVRRVDEKFFPQHTDTEHFLRNMEKIPETAEVIVTQKLHGTSVRFGMISTLVDDRTRWQKLLRRPVESKHRLVVGSRRVVKSVGLGAGEGKDHWREDGDLWTRYAEEHGLADLIPKDHIVYGEIVGYTASGSEIQKHYTYECEPGEAQLYVYRVAVVTSDGTTIDYTHNQMRQFCNDRGLKTVPVLHQPWRCVLDLMTVESFLDVNFYEEWKAGRFRCKETPIKLSRSGAPDEGVCIRYDGPFGTYITKQKSPKFLAYETKALDEASQEGVGK